MIRTMYIPTTSGLALCPQTAAAMNNNKTPAAKTLSSQASRRETEVLQAMTFSYRFTMTKALLTNVVVATLALS